MKRRLVIKRPRAGGMNRISGGAALALLLTAFTWAAPTVSGAPLEGQGAKHSPNARSVSNTNRMQDLMIEALRQRSRRANEAHEQMHGVTTLEDRTADRVRAASRLHRLSLRSQPSRLRAFNRGAALSATDLALPDSVTSASYASQGQVASYQGPFRSYHTHWSGFQSGVAAIFNFQPIVTVFYQGSIFSDALSARLFMAESFNLTASWDTGAPTDCSNTFGVPCELTGFATSSTSIALYSVAIINQCVIEVGFQGDATLIRAHQQDVTGAAASTQTLAINQAKNACQASNYVPPAAPTNTPAPPAATNTPAVPTSTPPPTNTPTPVAPQIQISALHVLLATSKTKSVETTSLKSSLQSGYFADLTYANAGSNAPQVTIAFSRNGTVFLTHKMQPVSTSASHVLFRITKQQLGPGQSSRFGDLEKFVSKKKKMHISATVQALLGTASDSATVNFTVAPNCKTTTKGKVCK